MKKKVSVLLIGGLPRPSGGVTVFLGRLVNRLGEQVSFHVLDIHHGDKEPSKAVVHKIAPKNKFFRMAWLVFNILFFRGDIVHFNYSLCHALVALALMPKFGRKFFITLHNGSQLERLEAFGRVKAALVKCGARKIDVAFSLCSNHCEAYERLGVPGHRIVKTKSQIPPPNITPELVDKKHAEIKVGHKHVLVSSGHVSRTYNFEFLIRFVSENSGSSGMLFLYGDHQDLAYLEELRKMPGSERVVFYFNKDEKTFLSALALSDVYVRPTHVDSWGIAVADAISLGIPAIASDVCERSDGAVLCDANNYSEFAAKLGAILSYAGSDNSGKSKDYAMDYLDAYTSSSR